MGFTENIEEENYALFVPFFLSKVQGCWWRKAGMARLSSVIVHTGTHNVAGDEAVWFSEDHKTITGPTVPCGTCLS